MGMQAVRSRYQETVLSAWPLEHNRGVWLQYGITTASAIFVEFSS